MYEIVMGTLTDKSVSIRSDAYGYRAYVNSKSDRAMLAAENPEDIVADVLAAWGDIPTWPEPEPLPVVPEDPGPTLTERVADIEDALTEMMFGDGGGAV